MQIGLFGNLRMKFAGRPITTINTNRLQSLIAYLILHLRSHGSGWLFYCGRPQTNRKRGPICGSSSII